MATTSRPSIPLWQRILASFDAPEVGDRASSVLVVGLGRFGSAMAEELVELGVEVLAVDLDMDLVQKWSNALPHVRQGDATNARVLKQLGASEFSVAVVAIGTGIEASLLTVTALLDIGMTNVWAKAISDEHEVILNRVGAHHVVSPEREMGERLAHMVSGQAIDYFALDEDFALVEVEAPKRFHGQTLLESGIRDEFGVTVVCIKPRGGSFTFAHPGTEIDRGDLLVIAGEVGNTDRFADLD